MPTKIYFSQPETETVFVLVEMKIKMRNRDRCHGLSYSSPVKESARKTDAMIKNNSMNEQIKEISLEQQENRNQKANVCVIG